MWCTNIWKTHINSSTWSAFTPQSRSSWSTLRKISRVLAVYVILSRVFTELVRWCSWLSTYELKHARMKTMRFHCDMLSYPVFSDPLVSSDEHQWCFDYSSSASPPHPPLPLLPSLHTATVVTVPGSHTRTKHTVDCLCSNSTVSPQKRLPYQTCSQALVSLLEDWQIWHLLRAVRSAPLCIWEAPTSQYLWGYAHQNCGNSVLQGNHLFHDTVVLNWKLKLKVLV